MIRAAASSRMRSQLDVEQPHPQMDGRNGEDRVERVEDREREGDEHQEHQRPDRLRPGRPPPRLPSGQPRPQHRPDHEDGATTIMSTAPPLPQRDLASGDGAGRGSDEAEQPCASTTAPPAKRNGSAAENVRRMPELAALPRRRARAKPVDRDEQDGRPAARAPAAATPRRAPPCRKTADRLAAGIRGPLSSALTEASTARPTGSDGQDSGSPGVERRRRRAARC